MSVDQIVSALKSLQAVLATVAKYTTTTLDDTLADVMGAILANDALIQLIKTLLGDAEVVSLKDEARTARIQTLAAAAPVDVSAGSITWATVLTYLPTIIRLLLSFTGKR